MAALRNITLETLIYKGSSGPWVFRFRSPLTLKADVVARFLAGEKERMSILVIRKRLIRSLCSRFAHTSNVEKGATFVARTAPNQCCNS